MWGICIKPQHNEVWNWLHLRPESTTCTKLSTDDVYYKQHVTGNLRNFRIQMVLGWQCWCMHGLIFVSFRKLHIPYHKRNALRRHLMLIKRTEEHKVVLLLFKIRNMLLRQCTQTYGACKIVMVKKRLNSWKRTHTHFPFLRIIFNTVVFRSALELKLLSCIGVSNFAKPRRFHYVKYFKFIEFLERLHSFSVIWQKGNKFYIYWLLLKSYIQFIMFF